MGTTRKDGPPVNPENVESVRYRAGMYGFLASLFNQRVSAQFVRRLKGGGVDIILADVNSENLLPDIRQGVNAIVRFVQYAGNLTDKEVEQELAVDWTRLFRGVSPKYGPPPPYEGIYLEGGGGTEKIMQDVCRYYSENGLTINETFQNRPDYIGIELDFLNYLSEREVNAMESGNDNRASECQRAARMFLLEHLGKWCGKFCDLAVIHAKTDFFRGLLNVTKGVVSNEMAKV